MGRAFEARRAAKEKRWGTMSRIFPKLAKIITMAAKAGGSDPESNNALKTAINNAKAQNMPKDNIEKAIKRATGNDATDYAEISYEGKGPHGSLFWVECATDNPTRTVANIKTIFNKSGGQVVNSGSLDFMFDRKAVIEFEKTEDMSLDEIELGLIDYGLEEMDVQEQRVLLYADFTQFGSLNEGCEVMKIAVKKASLQRIANSPVSFLEEEIEIIEALVDKLEEDDDVQAVYTNLA